jgi:hypothetical protein
VTGREDRGEQRGVALRGGVIHYGAYTELSACVSAIRAQTVG